MTDDSRKQNQSNMGSNYDQFADPRGMSMGWDLSNLPTNSGSKTNGRDNIETHCIDEIETSEPSSQMEEQGEHHPEADFDPFPEPRTVPTNWNVSALI
jgi:hypothetical protein